MLHDRPGALRAGPTMLAEPNRRLLRAWLPAVLAGFLLLLLALGAWALRGEAAGAPARGGGLAEVLGALGSGLVLLGALGLCAARVDGRRPLGLSLAALLWLGELALRLDGVLSPLAAGDAARAQALRLLLAGGAMAALASGVLRLFEGDPPPGLRLRWELTRWLFTLQLAACAALVLVGTLGRAVHAAALRSLSERVAERAAPGLTWLVFALPFAAAIFALAGTVRDLARRPTGLERL